MMSKNTIKPNQHHTAPSNVSSFVSATLESSFIWDVYKNSQWLEPEYVHYFNRTINVALLFWWSGEKHEAFNASFRDDCFALLLVWNACCLNASAAVVLKSKRPFLTRQTDSPTAQSDPEVSQLRVRQRHHFHMSILDLLMSTLALKRYGSWSSFLCQKKPICCYYKVWMETSTALGHHQPISAKCFHLSAICHSSGHFFPTYTGRWCLCKIRCGGN